jgi:transcriptional regulator GlxA family with amidase domain
MQNRLVRMMVFDRFEMLDALGPLEAFATASVIAGSGYDVQVVARDGGLVRSSSGLTMVAQSFEASRMPADTFLVSGGSGAVEASRCPQTLAYIRAECARSRRAGSVCTGAFLLAETGLLNGQTVATHWNWHRRLAQDYPEIRVADDPIFLRSGNMWTSAGVTSGIDMALAMIEEDYSTDLALRVARELVVFLRRPGGQAQFSAELKAQSATEPAVRKVQAFIIENPGLDLRVELLADIAGMSLRNFSRVFRDETGHTPAAFVSEVRLARACRMLEGSRRTIDEIAFHCGFNNSDVMRRVFLRLKSVTPSDYRARFGSAPADTVATAHEAP